MLWYSPFIIFWPVKISSGRLGASSLCNDSDSGLTDLTHYLLCREYGCPPAQLRSSPGSRGSTVRFRQFRKETRSTAETADKLVFGSCWSHMARNLHRHSTVHEVQLRQSLGHPAYEGGGVVRITKESESPRRENPQYR